MMAEAITIHSWWDSGPYSGYYPPYGGYWQGPGLDNKTTYDVPAELWQDYQQAQAELDRTVGALDRYIYDAAKKLEAT